MSNYWSFGLVVSVLFHALVLSGTPSFFKNGLKLDIVKEAKDTKKEIKIMPQKIEKIKKSKKLIRKLKDLPRSSPLPYMENIMDKLIDNNNYSFLKKPQLFENTSKEIIFSDLPQSRELHKNPAYMGYYRMIREKIRSNAYQKYNSARKGEVVVSFLVFKDGTLAKINLESESAGSRLLRGVAVDSVKDSAPFPPFPPELSDNTYLQFNISIYFKNS